MMELNFAVKQLANVYTFKSRIVSNFDFMCHALASNWNEKSVK